MGEIWDFQSYWFDYVEKWAFSIFIPLRARGCGLNLENRDWVDQYYSSVHMADDSIPRHQVFAKAKQRLYSRFFKSSLIIHALTGT